MEASGKMVVLDRMLSKLKARGHRVTLFSQYNRMLDVIEDYLIYRGYKCACRVMRLLVGPPLRGVSAPPGTITGPQLVRFCRRLDSCSPDRAFAQAL